MVYFSSNFYNIKNRLAINCLLLRSLRYRLRGNSVFHGGAQPRSRVGISALGAGVRPNTERRGVPEGIVCCQEVTESDVRCVWWSVIGRGAGVWNDLISVWGGNNNLFSVWGWKYCNSYEVARKPAQVLQWVTPGWYFMQDAVVGLFIVNLFGPVLVIPSAVMYWLNTMPVLFFILYAIGKCVHPCSLHLSWFLTVFLCTSLWLLYPGCTGSHDVPCTSLILVVRTLWFGRFLVMYNYDSAMPYIREICPRIIRFIYTHNSCGGRKQAEHANTTGTKKKQNFVFQCTVKAQNVSQHTHNKQY